MSQHDYVIDNQSAPSARADINSALAAIVTQNSGATAPATTYADMFWYDTANNQLKKRNEANSAWITLGTIDESTGSFTPTGLPAIATQAEAETGTNNTKMMTPLRSKQSIDKNSLGWGQTWQNVTASRANTTNYVNNTGKPIMVNIQFNQTASVGASLLVDSVTVSQASQQNIATGSALSTIVPNGSTYRLNSGSNGFVLWSELR